MPAAPRSSTSTLSPFQERLCRLRLSGMPLLQIAEHTNRSYGTVRIDFHRIYRILGIRLLCQLPIAYMAYEIENSRPSTTPRQLIAAQPPEERTPQIDN